MNNAQEITDCLTPEGIKNLAKGQILMFLKDGKRIDLKITKIKKGRIWAKEVRTYSVDEFAEKRSKRLKKEDRK